MMLILSTPLVFNDNPPEVEDKPVPREPVNVSVGEDGFPTGNCKIPVIVSPAFKTLLVAEPESVADIIPALKFPEASLATIAEGVFEEVAVVAEFETFPEEVIVSSFVSDIAAFGSISEFVISEVVSNPVLSL